MGGFRARGRSEGHCGHEPKCGLVSGMLHLNGANETEGKRKKKKSASMLANDNIF